MQIFQLNGIELHIPQDCLTETLVQAIRQERYESQEADALARHLTEADVVLELGAGAGYLSSIAAMFVTGKNVVAVEACKKMIMPLRQNLDRNNARDAKVVHGAVVADNYTDDSVNFLSRQAFWASAISPQTAETNPRVSLVPALKIGALFREHRPSVVVLDIEGGEAALTDTVWPTHIRLLVLEFHTKLYPNRTVQQLFDNLSRSGLTYMPWGSRGETVVFQRVDPPA